jgi:hypothetical protein
LTPQRHNTPAHRAIARAGWILVAFGLIGLIVWPGLIILWSAMILFGVAALPYALRMQIVSVARGTRLDSYPESRELAGS